MIDDIYIYTSFLAGSFTCRTTTKIYAESYIHDLFYIVQLLVRDKVYIVGRLQILTCATRQTSKQISLILRSYVFFIFF